MTGKKDLKRSRFNQGLKRGYASVENASWSKARSTLLPSLKRVSELDQNIQALAEHFDEYGKHIGVICCVLKEYLHKVLDQDTLYGLLQAVSVSPYSYAVEEIQAVLDTHKQLYEQKEQLSAHEHRIYSRTVKLIQKLNQ